MIPVADTNQVSEGLALLTGMFASATNVQGMLKSFLGPIQDLDDMIFATISGRLLANAIGDAVDKIGAIVGEARQGRNDTDYKAGIIIRISVNKSQGKAEDLLGISTLAFGSGNFTYWEGYPAKWQIKALNQPGFPAIAREIGQAKAAGTYGVIEHTQPTASTNRFVYGSVYGGISGKGSGTSYDSSFVSIDTDATAE